MIRRVLAPNPGYMTGDGTNTYLVDDGQGHVVVVDPGPADAVHLEAILRAAQPLGRIEAVLVTHGHLDHLPAALPLARRVGAPFCGHRGLPGVERALRDGETLALGNARLEALETPGHTDDSLCYWQADARSLFTGDLVAGAGTVIVDESPGGLSKYMASLERLSGIGQCAIYPGHGPAVEDGAAKLAEYLDHRRMRERQVLEVLRADRAVEVDEIVRQVYPDVVPALVPMAARNVRAHLGKLSDEGRVTTADGAWRLAG